MLKDRFPFAEGGRVEIRGARWLTLLVALLAIWPAGLAMADSAPFDPNQIVFPVVGGNVTFIDDFNQWRGDHLHGATDLMLNGQKGLPVVAAFDGVVTWIGRTCCYLAIDHGGGYETWYIHLDNDTPGTDDGLGWGIAPGIVEGTPVARGQLIGWAGDSGNAENVAPHLHFEIRLNGVPINPYPYLLVAPRLTAPGGALITSGTFNDDNGNPHEADIETLFAHGITIGCGPGIYCPLDPVTRGQIALFIYRQLDLAPGALDYYTDDSGSLYEEAANAITAVGIGFGCTQNTFCPDDPLIRDEMAELLMRTFNVAASGTDWFWDDNGSGFESAINAIKEAGITIGCNPLDSGEFCPDDPLTRGQMASFFVRAMGL
jgi:hypothetical protein